MQAQVLAAEKAPAAEIGGREAVVFLAPMGAHHAISFEAWQAVAQWAVVTDDAGVVQAVRDDTPAGDPERTPQQAARGEQLEVSYGPGLAQEGLGSLGAASRGGSTRDTEDGGPAHHER